MLPSNKHKDLFYMLNFYLATHFGCESKLASMTSYRIRRKKKALRLCLESSGKYLS